MSPYGLPRLGNRAYYVRMETTAQEANTMSNTIQSTSLRVPAFDFDTLPTQKVNVAQLVTGDIYVNDRSGYARVVNTVKPNYGMAAEVVCHTVFFLDGTERDLWETTCDGGPRSGW